MSGEILANPGASVVLLRTMKKSARRRPRTAFLAKPATTKAGLRTYGVKMAFTWEMKERSAAFTLEERVLIFRCRGDAELAKLVAKERKEYCRNDPVANFRIRPLSSKYLVFFIHEGDLADNPVEVFSWLRHGRRSKSASLKEHLW